MKEALLIIVCTLAWAALGVWVMALWLAHVEKRPTVDLTKLERWTLRPLLVVVAGPLAWLLLLRGWKQHRKRLADWKKEMKQ